MLVNQRQQVQIALPFMNIQAKRLYRCRERDDHRRARLWRFRECEVEEVSLPVMLPEEGQPGNDYFG